MLQGNTDISSLSNTQGQDRSNSSQEEDDTLNDLQNISSIPHSENSIDGNSSDQRAEDVTTNVSDSGKQKANQNITQLSEQDMNNSPIRYLSSLPPSSLPPSSSPPPPTPPPLPCSPPRTSRPSTPPCKEILAPASSKGKKGKTSHQKQKEAETDTGSYRQAELGLRHCDLFL